MEKMVQQKKIINWLISLVRSKDLFLKLASLCLGTLVWYFVVGADQVDMNIKIPIEVINLPEDMVIYNQYQKELNLTVRGPRSIMQGLRERNISKSIDLSKEVPDTIVVQIDSASIPLPSGITIQQLQPANITLSIDQLVQKEIPIHVVTDGEVKPGYSLTEIILNPDKIHVSGPKTIIDPQLALKTYTIKLAELKESATLPVHLNLSPDFIRLIGETTVVAKLKVQENIVKKTVDKVLINVKDGATELQVHPDSVTVVAQVPEGLFLDTPEPSMLFRAHINGHNLPIDNDSLSTARPVTVTGLDVPGHGKIIVESFTPTRVKVTKKK